jgi:transcriptional regulator with XRE-family HTH domain
MDRSKTQSDGPITLTNRSIGRRLRKLREANSMNTAQFAEIVQISEGRLVRVEQGLERLCAPEMMRVVRKFGTNVSYFMDTD